MFGVTVSSGIVSARKLSYTVIIPSGEAEAVLSVPTGDPAPGAATGDVTATVDVASGYEVGDPSSASVRLHVGDPMVTVRFDQESYSVPEDTGSLHRDQVDRPNCRERAGTQTIPSQPRSSSNPARRPRPRTTAQVLLLVELRRIGLGC